MQQTRKVEPLQKSDNRLCVAYKIVLNNTLYRLLGLCFEHCMSMFGGDMWTYAYGSQGVTPEKKNQEYVNSTEEEMVHSFYASPHLQVKYWALFWILPYYVFWM